MTTVRNWPIAAAGALVALGLTAPASRAAYLSSDNRLPSPVYRSTLPVIYATAGGQYKVDSFFDVFADFVRVPLPPVGGNEIHSFFDVFTELSFEPLGSSVTLHQAPSQQVIQMTRLNGLPPGEPVIDMEMLQLNLSGGTLPPGMMIRESPTLPSTGKTTITELGGGQYHIDSFFDVFTELSLDGGQTWSPASSPMHLNGDAPEPSTLILAALGLIGCMATTIRRARRGC